MTRTTTEDISGARPEVSYGRVKGWVFLPLLTTARDKPGGFELSSASVSCDRDFHAGDFFDIGDCGEVFV